MIRFALFVAMLLAAVPAHAQQLFADGFESGDGRAWDGNLGRPSYPSDGCHSGRFCGAMTLTGGVGQQSPDWVKSFTYSGPVLYISMWRQFPAGYSFDGAPSEPNNFHHKLLIIDTADSIGRMHFNLSGNGSSPQFRPEFEQVGSPSINRWLDARYPADGAWHQIELEITRRPGPGNGRLRFWLDGQLIYDQAGSTCGPMVCSPVVRLKMGAYVNQGAAKTETFRVDDVLVFGGTREEATGPVVVPVPPPRPLKDRLADVLELLDAAREEIGAIEAEQPQ